MGGAESQLAPNTVRRAKGRNQRKIMLEEIMKEYDKSCTGTLKRGEVKTMATKILGRVAPAMGGLSYDEIELIMCLGGDDTRPEISAEELPEALAIISSIKEENEELEKLFRKHDVDKSGDLPASQLKALLTEVNEGGAPSDDDITYVLKQCEPRGVADPIKKTQLKAAICCWYYASEEDVLKSAQEEKQKAAAAKVPQRSEEKIVKSTERKEKASDPRTKKQVPDMKLELSMAKIKAQQDDKEKTGQVDKDQSRAEELSLDEGNRRRGAAQDPDQATADLSLASPRLEKRPPPGGGDKEPVHTLKDVTRVPEAANAQNERIVERSEQKAANPVEQTSGVFPSFLFGSCRPCCRTIADTGDVRDAEAPVVYDST